MNLLDSTDFAQQETILSSAREFIPDACASQFKSAICHPELYLWDVWSGSAGNDLHLYCLAVSRRNKLGEPISPALRNPERFHIRHFKSSDGGASWADEGCYQQARTASGLFDSRNIWSGSILPLADGRQLTAYTGIRQLDEEFEFQQSLGLSISKDWAHAIDGSQQVLSDSLFDWQQITAQGYYLDDLDSLGHRDGEDGGPILAWRDPFLFMHDDQIHVFWGAKVNSTTPALGHAILTETDEGFALGELFPPIELPDGDQFTQLELPKIMVDPRNGQFYMILASCNRQHERQSDAEADKQVRMYRADALRGPWRPYGHQGSSLNLSEPHMFGITVIKADFAEGKIHYIAPYTEQAGPEKFLTLSPLQSLDLQSVSG